MCRFSWIMSARLERASRKSEVFTLCSVFVKCNLYQFIWIKWKLTQCFRVIYHLVWIFHSSNMFFFHMELNIRLQTFSQVFGFSNGFLPARIGANRKGITSSGQPVPNLVFFSLSHIYDSWVLTLAGKLLKWLVSRWKCLLPDVYVIAPIAQISTPESRSSVLQLVAF